MNIIYFSLILICAYAATKFSINLIQQRKCLSDREIQAYIDNNINDDKRRLIRAHISSCSACEEKFLDISLGRTRLEDNDDLLDS